MKQFINNAKVSKKLALISIAFIIPILILLYSLVSEQNIRIEFAEKELIGNAYLRPLESILEIAPNYNYLINKESNNEGVGAIAKSIDSKFDELLKYDELLNEQLVTKEKLSELMRAWLKLKNNNTDITNQLAFISELRGMIAYVGDKSNLILDPDLDSYYIMDAVLLKIPENIDLLYQILDLGHGIVDRGTISADEKTTLTVKTGLLKTNMTALYGGVNVAFDNNPSGNLKLKLSNSLEETNEKTNNYLEYIEKNILKSELINISTNDYEEVSKSALNENFGLWKLGSDNLDDLLNLRIEGFTNSKYFTLGSIFVVLILSLLLVISISRSISYSIHLLSEGAKRFSEGDSDVKILINSKDELGELSKIFNTMIAKINDSINLVKLEKESVELKIHEAVEEIEYKNKYLAESVDLMLSEMNKFAEGDLSIQLEIKSNDAIGKLFEGFNDAVASVHVLIVELKKAIQETVGASLQISHSTEEIASGSQEQSAQASEVTNAVEQLVKTIIETSKNTTFATNKSKQAGEIAKEGGIVVQETINGMNKIAEVVRKSALTVEKLGKSSDEIGEIIQVITDIAEQTNLLALNAAIEAARAGEQGRGFAVVADEVRKLAERTAKATKEIAQMIQQIQKDTAGAVESMKSGTGEVENGINLVNKAGNSLTRIINGANDVTEIVGMVAKAGEEQSATAELIENNIHGISHAISENTIGLQQIAEGAERLNGLSLGLENLISRFKAEKYLK